MASDVVIRYIRMTNRAGLSAVGNKRWTTTAMLSCTTRGQCPSNRDDGQISATGRCAEHPRGGDHEHETERRLHTDARSEREHAAGHVLDRVVRPVCRACGAAAGTGVPLASGAVSERSIVVFIRRSAECAMSPARSSSARLLQACRRRTEAQ